MARIVQKFGGTSVADVPRIRKAAEIALQAAAEGHEVATVVSAMGHTTDELISLAEQLSSEPSARELDMLLATGEQKTIALMSIAIQALGGQAKSFTGAQAGIVTESNHGQARIKSIDAAAVESSLTRGEIAVVAGFQGITENNEVTTLGRGGSDTTAVALSASLGADRCDIYTDVNGVFTADPRMFPEARKLSALSYEEMLELANAGAQVVNPRSVEMAMDGHIPVRVRSTFLPQDPGTLITHRLVSPEYIVTGIATDMAQAAVQMTAQSSKSSNSFLEGVANLFTRLNELDIQTDMVMMLAHEDEPTRELAFSVDRRSLRRVEAVINSFVRSLGDPEIRLDTDIAKVSVIGRGLSARPAVVAGIFDCLASNSIPVQMVSTSDLRVSALVPANRAREAVRIIHKRFGLAGLEI